MITTALQMPIGAWRPQFVHAGLVVCLLELGLCFGQIRGRCMWERSVELCYRSLRVALLDVPADGSWLTDADFNLFAGFGAMPLDMQVPLHGGEIGGTLLPSLRVALLDVPVDGY